jgi:transmembrane sensor
MNNADPMNMGHTIRETAHHWRARIDDGGLCIKEKAEFDDWMASDPEHAEAFVEAELLWQALGSVAYDMLDGTASEPSEKSGIVARIRHMGRMIPLSSTTLALSAIAAMLLLVVSSLYLVTDAPVSHSAEVATFTTAFNQTDEIRLADGSQVTLGAKTQIDVAVSDEGRAVQLLSGTAFFDVAHDPARPFIVTVGAAQVRVTGTAFDVQRKGDVMYVAVERGSVQVSQPLVLKSVRNALKQGEWTRHAGGMLSKVKLSAGQGVRASRIEGMGKVRAAEAGVWRSGQLVYLNAPIAEVAADANRYSEVPIQVGAAARGMKLSGTFDANDIEGLLVAIEAALPVVVETKGNASVIRKK